MIHSEFDHKKGILTTTYMGEITKDNMLDYFMFVYKDDSLPKGLKVYEDSRDATFKFDVMSNLKFRSLLKDHLSKFEYIMTAHVQNQTIETAYVYEYELRSKFPNYKFKVFQDPKNALEWLSLNFYVA